MEPVPGAAAGNMTYRATAGVKPRQGNSRFLLVADRKIDARTQTQDSPRRTSGHAAQIRGSELDHRRLKASPPPLHDHTLNSSGTDCGGGCRAVASTLDKGHQSKIDRRSSAQGHSLRLRHLHLFPLIPRERRYSGHGRTYVECHSRPNALQQKGSVIRSPRLG